MDVRQQLRRTRSIVRHERDTGLPVRQEDVDLFLVEWGGQDHRPGTVKRYRKALTMFYDWLPADKCIRARSVDRWLEELAGEGYSPNTLNYFGAVCNRWLKYMGAQEYRWRGKYEPGVTSLPAADREEYIRLLEAAKDLRDERSYLLIKVFANTGIWVSDLPGLTVEAVREGSVTSGGKSVRLPPSLCHELLQYAAFDRQLSGTVIRSRNGTALQEARIAKCLKEVSRAAGLPEGKGTPASLRKLYQDTKAALEAGSASDWVCSLEALLEREEASCGWKTAQRRGPTDIIPVPPETDRPHPCAGDAPRTGTGRREEYLHLLDTAKRLDREQAYLLVKIFAVTGISVSQLSELTAEAIREGAVRLPGRDIALPVSLQKELLAYAGRKDIQAGPVFITRTGRPFDMQRVSGILRDLGRAAGLGEGRSRPGALRKLYSDARAAAESRAADMVQRLMNEQADAEQEQLAAGWEV